MKIIRIFLASSKELKNEREQFELFINRKNKNLVPKGVFLHLEIWEDFLDCMSKTRLQDEYNNSIKNSDIFLMLFFSKVGKYTSEEFETALNSREAKNSPIIYIYKKTPAMDANGSKESDTSVAEFLRTLKKLEHPPTEFKNIEALKFNFNDQLEKLGITNQEPLINSIRIDEEDEIEYILDDYFGILAVNEKTLKFDFKQIRTVKLKSLIDGKQFVSQNASTGSSKALEFENFDIKIDESKTKRKSGFVFVEERLKSDLKNNSRICFTPALIQNEIVEFCTVSKSDSRRFLAFEDFDRARYLKQYPMDKLDDVLIKTIKSPTRKFIRTIEFPPNYPSDGSFSFSVKKNGKLVNDEMQRNAKAFKIFRDEKNALVIRLEINYPKKGYSYGLRWIPQPVSKLLQNKIITDIQGKEILQRARLQ